MTYKQFNKYFNDEFKNKIKKKEITQENNQSLALENIGPIKLKINTKPKKYLMLNLEKTLEKMICYNLLITPE